jgi:hypothetical protein
VCRLASFLWSCDGLKFLAKLGSVAFGVLGTWLMSRRYARRFWPNLFFAFLFPVLYLFGQGGHVRDFVKTTININRDIEDSVIDMTIGLNLLFWAFVLQLIALGIETLK